MIQFNKKNGYSNQTYSEYVGDTKVIILIGAGPSNVNKFVDNKPTDELINKKMEFYFEGLGSQSVKFPADFELDSSIKDLSEVELLNPQAITFKNKFYVKADGINLKK